MTDIIGKTIAAKWGVALNGVGEKIKGCYISAPDDWNEKIPWRPTDTDPRAWHNQCAVTLRNQGQEVHDTRITNVGDAISCSSKDGHTAANILLETIDIVRVHDDAIENDIMCSFTARDVSIDGCSVAISTRYGSSGVSVDGRDNLIELDNFRVRLQGYPGNWAPNKHGGFFKQAYKSSTVDTGHQPNFFIHDSVFAAGDIPWGSEKLDAPDPANGWNGGVVGNDITLCWLGSGVWPENHLVRWRKYVTNLVVLNGDAAKAVWAARV